MSGDLRDRPQTMGAALVLGPFYISSSKVASERERGGGESESEQAEEMDKRGEPDEAAMLIAYSVRFGRREATD